MELVPQAVTIPATPTMHAMTTQPNTVLVRDWHICDAKALAIIVGTVADEVLPHIQTAKTSFEAWTILRDMYELNEASFLDMETKLYSMGKGSKRGL